MKFRTSGFAVRVRDGKAGNVGCGFTYLGFLSMNWLANRDMRGFALHPAYISRFSARLADRKARYAPMSQGALAP